jgi:hypothetical protein
LEGNRVFSPFFKMKEERVGKDLFPSLAKWQLEMAFPSLKREKGEKRKALLKCIQ